MPGMVNDNESTHTTLILLSNEAMQDLANAKFLYFSSQKK